jgi:hypothetical protein
MTDGDVLLVLSAIAAVTSRQVEGFFLSTASIPASVPPLQKLQRYTSSGVNQTVSEDGHLSNNEWSYKAIPPLHLHGWCTFMFREKNAFTFACYCDEHKNIIILSYLWLHMSLFILPERNTSATVIFPRAPFLHVLAVSLGIY